MSNNESNSTSNGKKSTSTTTFGEAWPELNDGLTYTDLIRVSDAGSTVIDFYSNKYKSSAPLQGWLQRIYNQQITVDGRVVSDPRIILRADEKLVYQRLPWKEPDAPYLLKVLYEDDDLMIMLQCNMDNENVSGLTAFAIALDKPSGLQVLPGGLFQQRTVLTQLQWRACKHLSRTARPEPNPVPVHRLGRGTSGILLCAKTKIAKSRLSSYFADGTSAVGKKRCTDADINSTRKISKVYRALASGLIHEDEVVIEQPIGIVKYPGVATGLYVASSSGKPALSKVHVLQRDVKTNCTIVQVEIQSGRPHQIRIHLSFIGHPLLGDPLYIAGGQPQSFTHDGIGEMFAEDGGYTRPENPVPGDCGYQLHAHKLVLTHPTTNEIIRIVAPLPPMLQTSQESSV